MCDMYCVDSSALGDRKRNTVTNCDVAVLRALTHTLVTGGSTWGF